MTSGKAKASKKSKTPGKAKSSGTKIGIFGLDNAGKTTIVEVLEDQKDLHILATLHPTVRVKVHELLALLPDWVIWDFGGQAAYRQEYLAMPERYFYDLALMIFVFDAQDPTRFDMAIQYFSECVKYSKINSPNIEILILLHKADPDVIGTSTIQENLHKLQGLISNVLEQHQQSGKIFTSTIFDATLQLSDANLGSLNQPSRLAPLVEEAKKLHKQLNAPPVTPVATGSHAVVESGQAQKVQGTKSLKALSLERRRIIEEFRALLRK